MGRGEEALKGSVGLSQLQMKGHMEKSQSNSQQ